MIAIAQTRFNNLFIGLIETLSKLLRNRCKIAVSTIVLIVEHLEAEQWILVA
jgi:hypothetical protein